MVDNKSIISSAPAILAATGGLITAIVGLLTFMSAPAPSIATFDASPNIIYTGESSILKWSVIGDGATVEIEPGIGIVGLSGTREVAPIVTANYTLTAKNKDQEKIAFVQLIVKEKQEDNQLTEDTVEGIIAKSEVSMPRSVKAELDQKQNEIDETLPETESDNPDEPAGIPDFDLQQNAIEKPVQMVARTSNPSESTATDQPGLRQDAIVAPVSIIETDTAANLDTASKVAALREIAPESNATEPVAHVEPGLTESNTIDETPATYSNESNPAKDSTLDTVSDEDGSIIETREAKVISAADWDRLNKVKVSRSENDFASNAPIYAKLKGIRHASANADSSYSQDPAASDRDIADLDYLGKDIQSQSSSRMDAQFPGASGSDTPGPDGIPQEASVQ